ncbi:MAG: hypothetical protein ABSA26_02040 [Thermoguttaceae bacterium]|jgi:F0F1-type ATP synthase assembly protein I
MDSDSDKTKLKWYQMRRSRIRLTGEYCGGLIAGFGVGIMLMPLVTSSHFIRLVFILGIALAITGDFIAMHAQRRKLGDSL